MFLSAVNFNAINTFKLSRVPTKPISFCAKNQTDTFEKCARIEKIEYTTSLSDEAKEQLKTAILEIANNPNTPVLGYGATGAVYQAKNIEGLGVNGVAIKFSYTQDRNPITGERQKVGCNFKDETHILKQVRYFIRNSQHYLADVKLEDGRQVLVTSFVEGVEPNPISAPVNEKALASLIITLQKLDVLGILHRDLKKENLLIGEDNNIRIIDFGEAIEFDVLDFKGNDENNFPAFEAPTNFQSFEDTFISPYIDELQKTSPKEAKKFFRKYLTLKSELNFKKRAQNLYEFKSKNISKLYPGQVKRLERMIDYQSCMATVLSEENLSDNILAIELMKNQVMYLSELAYKNEILLCNPLANISMKANALISAKKLEAMVLSQINRPNKPEVRKYLDYQLQNARYRQERIAGWLNGLVSWFTTCLTTDINTTDENKKKLIDECAYGQNLEDFEIPNIANGVQ